MTSREMARIGELFRNSGKWTLPANVASPLAAWSTPYAAMAREDELAWLSLDEVTKAAQTFLDPVLAGELDATWEPETWSWRLV